jgi:hypothetical protein
MSERKRLHRADPARTAPIRDFSKLYSRTETTNGPAAAKPLASEKPRPAATAASPLAEGVELAYSVIEKYIAEGRRTAEGLSTQPYATRAANGNLQDILERMLRFQAEALPLWVEMLATLVKVEPPRNGYATSAGAWPHRNGKKPAATVVPIEVASIRPVQVSLELVPNSDTHSLVALALSSVAPGKPTLTQVSFVRDKAEGRVKLRVQIPDQQPAGTYTGVVVDRDSGEARGTLRVRLGD